MVESSRLEAALINGEQRSRRPLSGQEKRGIVLLLVLYTIQGLPLGFFGGGIQLLLLESGISLTQLAELSVVFYPFTFKFLLAPVQDAYFSRTFGKRKSYVVPLQYALAIIFVVVGWQIESLLAEQKIFALICFGFTACLIASQQDVAVDGWVLTIFESEDHVSIGSTCNTIGQTLGVVIANGLFIQLNSVDFCNRFIFSEHSTQPLVSARVFLYVLAAIIFTVTLFVHFFVKEKTETVVAAATAGHHVDSVTEVVKKLRGFYTNKNLRMLLVFLLLCNIGVSPMRGSLSTLLMKHGMHKEIISSIGSLMIPVGFIAAIFANRFIKPQKEMNIWKYCYGFFILESLAGWAIVSSYPKISHEEDNTTLVVLLLLLSFFSSAVGSARFVAIGGFFNRISDEDLGGSSLTALNSFSNLGGQLSEQISLLALSLLPLNIVVAVGLALAILFAAVAKKVFIPLQELPKTAWALEGQTQNQGQQDSETTENKKKQR